MFFNYCSHPQTGDCLKAGEKVDLPMKQNATTQADPFMIKQSDATTEHNPYSANYSGEYGKEFDHYVEMGVNESDVQQSIDKIVDYEIKKATDELSQQVMENDISQDFDGYILLDVAGNELEPLKHPQFVTDHHAVNHHEEAIAMVTVGCLILGMLVFLLAMVYIRRITRKVPATLDIEQIDVQKPQKVAVSKIVHEPLPSRKHLITSSHLLTNFHLASVPPLRSSLRKAKSVTFDESIDEVDECNRLRTKSLPDAYDIPRKQTSMMDLYAQSVKITPRDIAAFQINATGFNTFPRKTISRQQSLDHIYDEIPFSPEISDANRTKSGKIEDLSTTDTVYENQESIEKTKM